MSKDDALKVLKYNKPYLSRFQLKTIRGQILSGNIAGALKGIETIKDAKMRCKEKAKLKEAKPYPKKDECESIS